MILIKTSWYKSVVNGSVPPVRDLKERLPSAGRNARVLTRSDNLRSYRSGKERCVGTTEKEFPAGLSALSDAQMRETLQVDKSCLLQRKEETAA